jgi:Tat protein translocase TatB subunit
MFNLGFSEVIAIAVVALIVIGPKQLPEVAKVIGRLMGEFRKATQDLSGGLLEVKREVETSIHDVRDSIVSEGHKIKDSILDVDPLEPHEHPDHLDHPDHPDHLEHPESYGLDDHSGDSSTDGSAETPDSLDNKSESKNGRD